MKIAKYRLLKAKIIEFVGYRELGVSTIEIKQALPEHAHSVNGALIQLERDGMLISKHYLGTKKIYWRA